MLSVWVTKTELLRNKAETSAFVAGVSGGSSLNLDSGGIKQV